MAHDRQARGIEGHYNYYGVPAYILKQRNNTYTCGFYDPAEGVFKASGSIQKILWDGVRISVSEAKRLIQKYASAFPNKRPGDRPPDWVMTQEEAVRFLKQSGEISEGADALKNLFVKGKQQKRS